MSTINTKTTFLVLSTCLISLLGCKKFLDLKAPVTSINQENVYQNDYTAAAVVTGIYAKMMDEFYSGGITSISLLQELAADNLVFTNPTQTGYLNWWRNSFTADYFDTGGYNNYFINFYPKVYIVNAVIEGLTKSTSLTHRIKQRLLGEAYFIRSFYYFYLVNLYGDLPLVTSTDYKENVGLRRTPVDKVYQLIISDLNQSINLLDDSYVDASIIAPTSERIRPNLSTALSLLARVQLYQKNYLSAISTSTIVINKSSIYSLVNLDSVFKKNNSETIWALQPVKTGYNTDEAAVFLLDRIPGTLGPKYSYSSPSLISNFDPEDQRLLHWMGNFVSGDTSYPYPAKYKTDANTTTVDEYCIVFRLAEQYLIRAEAEAQTNNLENAKKDLNIIRKRAGLPLSNATSKDEILKAILKERRSELFTEWGHRWFDLKRTGNIDNAMQAAMSFKGGTWASYKALYPIPNTEILINKNLDQNAGY